MKLCLFTISNSKEDFGMPVTGLKHTINAYTIETSGTPAATIKAASILDAMKFTLDDFECLRGNGWWDGEEPFAIRNATWLEKDELLAEMKRTDQGYDGHEDHFVYWHSRESTKREDAAYNSRIKGEDDAHYFE
jgi:hypothetical protein